MEKRRTFQINESVASQKQMGGGITALPKTPLGISKKIEVKKELYHKKEQERRPC